MSIEFTLLVYIILSIVCVILICPLAINLSELINLKDNLKDQKRISTKAIPLVGGLVIFPLLWVLFFSYTKNYDYFNLFILSILIFLVGLYDDFFNLRPLIKFSLPLIICFISIFLGYKIDLFENKLVNILFSFIWIYGFTNSFNFLDNMDGIMPGVLSFQSFFLMCFSYVAEQNELAFIFSLFFGLNLGFLYYNFNPASVYLGDSGSLSQGFLISIFLIEFDWNFTHVSLKFLVPCFFLGYCILDTTYVVFGRLYNGQRPWLGDTNHTSHKLLKSGFSFRMVALIIYAMSAIFSFTAFLIYNLEYTYSLLVLIICLIITLFYLRKLNGVAFE